MLAAEKTGEKYKTLLEKAVKHVELRGFNDIRTELNGYDDPNGFSQKEKKNEYIPDITASNKQGKFYFEIAQKTENVNKLVSKWKLLSTIAEMKNGSFSIMVPYGLNKFTEELIDTYKIDAKVIKME